VILGDGTVQAFGNKEEVLSGLTGPRAIRTEASSAPSRGSAVGGMRAPAL
jgi:hypothetical protein